MLLAARQRQRDAEKEKERLTGEIATLKDFRWRLWMATRDKFRKGDKTMSQEEFERMLPNLATVSYPSDEAFFKKLGARPEKTFKKTISITKIAGRALKSEFDFWFFKFSDGSAVQIMVAISPDKKVHLVSALEPHHDDYQSFDADGYEVK
ncbi:hypothetical protein JYT15_00575 [Acidimicrobium ferrooxidans]|nr:hypothetical protein [Acidimicrobium ferrooxidans]